MTHCSCTFCVGAFLVLSVRLPYFYVSKGKAQRLFPLLTAHCSLLTVHCSLFTVMSPILVLDNYDSFTYNLVQYVSEQTDRRIEVRRNDAITLDEVEVYDDILLSPGPGLPSESGILCDLIRHYAPTKRILGICLGHQAMVEVFGGTLINLDRVAHGMSTVVRILEPEEYLFGGLESEIEAGLYHSWAVDQQTLPEDFQLTALSAEGVVMGVAHKKYDLRGLQFHPESVLTPHGRGILKNWLTAVPVLS